MVTEPQKSVIYSDLCFGCGMKNPMGLKLKFSWDGRRKNGENGVHPG